MTSSTANEPTGLLLCDDLIFTSRIVSTARSLGLTIKTARSGGDLERLATAEKPCCVILDLANPGLSVADVIQRFRPEGKVPVIVAYGSHVDAAGLNAARAAGCDLVLPRSKFVADLPTALPHWFAGSISESD
jgi:CheY-like chemotaxis protein